MNPYSGDIFYYQMQRYRTSYLSKPEVDLKSQMRRLWGEHVAWIRMTISSLVLDLPDASFAVARLLKTATDMGNSLRPFYGGSGGQCIRETTKRTYNACGGFNKGIKRGK